MRTIVKVILGLLLVFAIASACLGLFGIVVGASFSLIGVVMGFVGMAVGFAVKLAVLVIRLALNPIVLILLAAFVLSGRYKGSA